MVNIHDWNAPIPRHEHNETVAKLEKAKRELYVTLLDQFAMAALTGIMANIGVVSGHAPTDRDVARWVFDTAEAMMKERESREI